MSITWLRSAKYQLLSDCSDPLGSSSPRYQHGKWMFKLFNHHIRPVWCWRWQLYWGMVLEGVGVLGVWRMGMGMAGGYGSVERC